MIQLLQKEIVLLQNKYEYIQEVLDGTIDLRKKTTEQIYTILQDRIKLENTGQPFTIDEFYERNEQSQLDIKNKNYLDHEVVKSKFGL